jgi:Flp pilus assembly protein TadD
VLVVFVLLSAVSVRAAPALLEQARELYQRSEYAAALKILLALPEKGAAAYGLIGQCYYMQGDPKKASLFLERAVSADPSNSSYLHWLGRAYGRRAETSSFFTAPRFALRARQSFERAVQQDPRNLEAINDLFEYYLEAPGLLGGGLDKAGALAERIRALDSVEYHYAQAKLAEKRRQFQTAENHFRRAVELAPREVGRLIDLAEFFAQQGRYRESDRTFSQAREIAPDSPAVLFEQAKAYILSGRNLEAARALLKQYLASELTPDDPPRGEAEKLLKLVSSS